MNIKEFWSIILLPILIGAGGGAILATIVILTESFVRRVKSSIEIKVHVPGWLDTMVRVIIALVIAWAFGTLLSGIAE